MPYAVRLDDKTKQVLESLSKRDGRPQGTLVQEALVIYYERFPVAREKIPSKRVRKPRK